IFNHIAAQDRSFTFASSGSAHALTKTGNGRGRANLGNALDRSDIDAEFQCVGADGSRWLILLFERSLSVVANFFGKTAMVRPELARHASLFAKLIEQVGIALDLPAAVGKDQIVAAAKGFEQ
ncbi:hypothetical protein XEUV354_23980, partial [Xanthomonas euvesicatoria]